MKLGPQIEIRQRLECGQFSLRFGLVHFGLQKLPQGSRT